MKKEQSKEDIQNLLDKMVSIRSKYEEKKSAKLQQELDKIQSLCIEKLNYLVEDRAKRYKGFSNYEDLYQDGRLALYRALQTYEPERGDFFWWANKYVKTKISREANNHSTIKIPLKKAKDLQPYKVSKIPTIVDCSENALDNLEKQEMSRILKNAIDKLPTNQKKVINFHYEFGNSDNSAILKICDSMKISRVMCVKLLEEAKENLKTELSNTF